jgi:hypothetical protein
MAIRFLCPFGHHLVVPDNRAGKKGRCPTCQQKVIVPVPNPVPPKPEPSAKGAGKEEEKEDLDPWDAFVEELVGADRTPAGQQLGFESEMPPPAVSVPVKKPSPPPAKSSSKDNPPTPPAAPRTTPPKPSAPQQAAAPKQAAAPQPPKPRPGVPVPPPPPARRPNPPAASAAQVEEAATTPLATRTVVTTLSSGGTAVTVPASVATPASTAPSLKTESPAVATVQVVSTGSTSPQGVTQPVAAHQEIPSPRTRPAPRLEGYRPDRDTLHTVHWLAVALVLVTAFSAVPVVQHWNLSIAPVWAQVIWLLVVCQLVYIAWLVSLPDWTTTWMGVLVFTPVAAIYGGAIAIVLSTPMGKTLVLDLADVRDMAAGWSAANMMLMALMSFACGRVGSKWHRRISLLPRSLRSTSALSAASSHASKSAWSPV